VRCWRRMRLRRLVCGDCGSAVLVCRSSYLVRRASALRLAHASSTVRLELDWSWRWLPVGDATDRRVAFRWPYIGLTMRLPPVWDPRCVWFQLRSPNLWDSPLSPSLPALEASEIWPDQIRRTQIWYLGLSGRPIYMNSPRSGSIFGPSGSCPLLDSLQISQRPILPQGCPG
jgi:hypothetical protein